MKEKMGFMEKARNSKAVKWGLRVLGIGVAAYGLDQGLNHGDVGAKIKEEFSTPEPIIQTITPEQQQAIDKQKQQMEENLHNFSDGVRQNWAESERDGIPGSQDEAK